MHKMGWLGVTQGCHQPFDRSYTIFYSSLIETMRPSCTIFEMRRVICRNSPSSTYPTWGFKFRKDFWHQKTRVPWAIIGDFGVVCVILRLAVLVEHRLVTDRHRHIPWQGIYHAEHSSRVKMHKMGWLGVTQGHRQIERI